MKKETIITMSAISLVTLAAIGGFAFYSFAASPTSSGTDATGIANSFFGRHWRGRTLTTEEQAQFDQKQVDAQARFDAVQKALTANDYNAWVAAIKAINPNAPVLTKINSGNFSKFVEANSDIQNAHAILKDLGIDGPGYGIGMGPGFGGRGMMGGFGGRGMMGGFGGRGMMGRWFR